MKKTIAIKLIFRISLSIKQGSYREVWKILWLFLLFLLWADSYTGIVRDCQYKPWFLSRASAVKSGILSISAVSTSSWSLASCKSWARRPLYSSELICGGISSISSVLPSFYMLELNVITWQQNKAMLNDILVYLCFKYYINLTFISQ